MAHIEKRSRTDGTAYRVKYRTLDGEQRSKTFWDHGQAKAFSEDVEADKRAGRYVDPRLGRISLQEWSEEYLATLHVEPKTMLAYRSLLRSRILPVLGERSLTSLRPRDVQRWVGKTAAEVSAERTRQGFRLLKAILELAVDWGCLRKNPCVGVNLPTVVRSERTILTPGEVKAVAQAAGDYEKLVLFLAFSGCRWGEAAALTYKRLSDNSVRVSEAYSEVSGHLHLTTPKNGSARTVFLPPSLVAFLGTGEDEQLVFPSPRGTVLRANNWRRRTWGPACESVGVKARIHDLRHTCASLLIRQGAHPKVIQEHLGHRDIRTTMNIYGHLYDEQRRTTSAQLQEIWTEFSK